MLRDHSKETPSRGIETKLVSVRPDDVKVITVRRLPVEGLKPTCPVPTNFTIWNCAITVRRLPVEGLKLTRTRYVAAAFLSAITVRRLPVEGLKLTSEDLQA